MRVLLKLTAVCLLFSPQNINGNLLRAKGGKASTATEEQSRKVRLHLLSVIQCTASKSYVFTAE